MIQSLSFLKRAGTLIGEYRKVHILTVLSLNCFSPREIDCAGRLVAPGLIDLQINGGFGVDFSFDIKDEFTAKECLHKVGYGLLKHGKKSEYLYILYFSIILRLLFQ